MRWVKSYLLFLLLPTVYQVTWAAPALAVLSAIWVIDARFLVAWPPPEVVAPIAHAFAVGNPLCMLAIGR